MLALTGKARLWKPRRLRLRLFTVAGQLVATGRRRIFRLARQLALLFGVTSSSTAAGTPSPIAPQVVGEFRRKR